MKRIIINVLLYTFLLPGVLEAEVKLPRLISDGMVLQRDKKIPVWGWALPGEKVSVTFNSRHYTVFATADKKWRLLLPAMKAGGPYSMKITGSNQIIIKDILIGDVWICSGQSNMEFWMGRVKTKYRDIIAFSNNSKIRQFLVKQNYDFMTPEEDTESDGWKCATPENVLQFTAVGYFFARSLYDKYKVPVGLINSSRGGSPAEAWISAEALKPFPAYYDEASRLKDSLLVKQIIAEDRQASNEWFSRAKNEDKGMSDTNNLWYSTTYNAEGWSDFLVPNLPERIIGDKSSSGVLWVRKEINLPDKMASQEAVLCLGNITDDDDTYFNGTKVGSVSSRYFLREYKIPARLMKPGKNVIAVRIIVKNVPGGFIRDKPYKLVAGGESISLEGQWKYKAGVILPSIPRNTTFAYKPAGLYNAMIAPLTGYAIKGVIWYQGEANTNRAAEYRRLFPALIADWRKQWRSGNFPFLYVQLTSYLQRTERPAESQWAELREAQTMALSVSNTGMAVTIDVGEWNDVHPENKEDVGKRLALAARKVAYNEKNLVYSGPVYRSGKITGNKIILSFRHTGSGLMPKAGEPLKYFSIAGKDSRFVWANARITGNKIIVWSDQISKPVYVRYAWADNPEGANLYNKDGLPASPFRTDTHSQRLIK